MLNFLFGQSQRWSDSGETFCRNSRAQQHSQNRGQNDRSLLLRVSLFNIKLFIWSVIRLWNFLAGSQCLFETFCDRSSYRLEDISSLFQTLSCSLSTGGWRKREKEMKGKEAGTTKRNRFCARAGNYLWNLCKCSIKFQFPINYLIRSHFNLFFFGWCCEWIFCRGLGLFRLILRRLTNDRWKSLLKHARRCSHFFSGEMICAYDS